MNSYDVVVIDYNTGNVDSVIKAVRLFGKNVILSNDIEIIKNSKKIILPGQGSFNYGMDQLNKLNLVKLIKTKANLDQTPILGICLGMQILANLGYENKVTEGLNLIDGKVKKISTNLKLPHIGWNEVYIKKKNNLISKIENNKDFYFVHSYYYECIEKDCIIATSTYGHEFATIINKDNIFGVQFHPEKSLKSGLQIIRNFLEL